MDAAEPTGGPDDAEAESFETTREVIARTMAGPEDWFLRVTSFEFVESSEPVDAYVRRDDGLEVSEKEADCRLSLAVPHHPLGRLRCALASVCST